MSTLKAKNFHFIEDMDIAALVFAAVERVEALAANVNSVFGTWVRRSQDRRMLAMMSERMLRDVGLSPYDVEQEVAKYFWQK